MLPCDIYHFTTTNNSTCFTKTLLCIQLFIFLVILMSYTLLSASLIAEGSNRKYTKKNIQIACSQINILYLSNVALNNIPNRCAVKKRNWGFRVLGGSNRKQQSFWRKYERTKVFKFYKNLLNTWKRTTGKNYFTCKVQRVKKVKLNWVDNKLD